MSISTSVISGFGIDLTNDDLHVFSDFFNNHFDQPFSNKYITQIIELWFMKKIGHDIPTGSYFYSYDALDNEWQNYHRLVRSEEKDFPLSFQIYGNSYADDGQYLLVLNETLMEIDDEVKGHSLKKEISSKGKKQLEEFLQYFKLPSPDWHVVYLTC